MNSEAEKLFVNYGWKYTIKSQAKTFRNNKLKINKKRKMQKKRSQKQPKTERKNISSFLPNSRPSISKITWDTLFIDLDILAFDIDTNCELERLALNNRFIFRMEYLYALGSVECYTLPSKTKNIVFTHT